MNFAELVRYLSRSALNDAMRPIRLRLMGLQGWVDDMLLMQRMDITEAVFDGVTAHLTCVSLRSHLRPEMFLGMPVEVQVVTDRGTLRRFCLMVMAARAGEADGGLAVYQLTARDAFAVLELRTNTRHFMNESVLGIARILLKEHRAMMPVLGSAFDYRLLQIDESRYPARAFTRQSNESDAAFLRRLFRQEGLSWCFHPVEPEPGGDDTPRHELLLFDDSWRLPENAAGALHYRRVAGVAEHDGIDHWSPSRRLVSGKVKRHSWDYKGARMTPSQTRSLLDQGEVGSLLASALMDTRIEIPHAGDSWQHFDRQTRRGIERHEYEAQCVQGSGDVRDLTAGAWGEVKGHPALGRSEAQRQYVFTHVRHWAQNNLPDELATGVQALLSASEAAPGWAAWPAAQSAADQRSEGGRRGNRLRYRNAFTAVPRVVPVVPSWNPATDFPPTPPTTAVVVGEKGQVVWVDGDGRVQLQFHGMEPQDHAHADGAGTNGLAGDSAWVRNQHVWAGVGLGVNFPLRVGMEVQIAFQHGDPSRPVITGVCHNGANPPPRFSHTGQLPHERALSGVVSGEIQGHRANQLRFDDTTGQISAQLASDHGQTQLNLGHLTHPRSEGYGAPRGEGFELRSDQSGVIRTAKSLLITAWKRLDAAGTQLSSTEHAALMEDCLALFKSLGQYAMQHNGLAVDTDGQTALRDDLQAAPAGSNIDPEGIGGQPTLSLTAPAGIAMSTPKTLLSYAGVNIDCVAQQHLQYTAGQRCSVNAGQGIGLFAHHGGLQAIAHHGKLLLQSQHDDLEANAANNIKWTATNGQLTGMAKEIVLIAEDGSFIKIGGGITLGTNGAISSKAASFPHSGPATLATEFPVFGAGAPDQKFRLHYGDGSGPLAAHRRYEITLSDGSVQKGVSDSEGLTALLARDAMHIAAINILTDE